MSMTNKWKGIFLYILGVLILFISTFSDHISGRPLNFGPKQIALTIFGFAMIYLGRYIQSIKTKDIYLSIKNKLLPHKYSEGRMKT